MVVGKLAIMVRTAEVPEAVTLSIQLAMVGVRLMVGLAVGLVVEYGAIMLYTRAPLEAMVTPTRVGVAGLEAAQAALPAPLARPQSTKRVAPAAAVAAATAQARAERAPTAVSLAAEQVEARVEHQPGPPAASAARD